MPAKSASKKNRVSGFEDGFADPPLTPDEHAVEQMLYDPGRPFYERIEECIQRFVARRRLSQDRNLLFQKYLALGGIDNTQRQFTGTADLLKDWKEDDYTVDEIRGFTADNFLSHDDDAKGKWFNPSFPEHWDVDFAGVVAGFLGSYLPESGGLNAPEIRLAADTILNFLKYVRHHDVCPEYAANLEEATRICELALTELPRVAVVGRDLPGDFNLACRILFCSTGRPMANEGVPEIRASELTMYEDRKVAEGSGEMIKPPGSFDTAVFAPADLNAERVFKTTIALHEPQLVNRVCDMQTKPVRVINAFEEAYEVKEIVFAEAHVEKLYEGLNEQNRDVRPVGPVGYIVLHAAVIENGWDKHPASASGRADDLGRPVSVYMDHAVLQHLRVGMKLRLTMCELDVGLTFVKEVTEALPSFYVFLPQSLMMQWKAPRPDTRPPPSADDPDAAEAREREEVMREEREMVIEHRKIDPELDREMREMEDVDAVENAMKKSKI